jgi:uncharacterized coiled-coil protein SlyX
MSINDAADSALNNRLEKIESAIAHLQNELDSLNASLLKCLRQIHDFDARFRRIESEMLILDETPERRDPRQERPPHY